mmetsp:Transcript_42536/g.129083  ORF Transcript_42536/g.129083 Transcript_42536/m.129083 type:complete len:217 (-) Transcript_42536:1137-1787(-)
MFVHSSHFEQENVHPHLYASLGFSVFHGIGRSAHQPRHPKKSATTAVLSTSTLSLISSGPNSVSLLDSSSVLESATTELTSSSMLLLLSPRPNSVSPSDSLAVLFDALLSVESSVLSSDVLEIIMSLSPSKSSTVLLVPSPSANASSLVSFESLDPLFAMVCPPSPWPSFSLLCGTPPIVMLWLLLAELSLPDPLSVMVCPPSEWPMSMSPIPTSP